MIPQAGSAYAYSYATLGELVAWIIGWDLILEYAVGNVAVAISWGDYFNTLLRGFGVTLPVWLTTGYRTALLSSDPADPRPARTRRRTSPASRSSFTLPAFAHRAWSITWLLLRGARESATANNIMVVIKLLALALFIVVGATHLHAANYHPFAPNGFTGIHQGAAIVFFAYIGFDAISTAAEETQESAAQPADRHPRRARHLHADLRRRRRRADRDGAVPASSPSPIRSRARWSWPASRRSAGSSRSARRSRCRRCCSCSSTASRASSSRWRATACCRSGRRSIHPRTQIPWATTLFTGVFVAAWSLIGDAGETYDLTNIGTLFAFMLVSIGVLVLRHTRARSAASVPRAVRVAGRAALGRGLPVHHERAAARGVGAVRRAGWSSGSCCTSRTGSGTAGCARPTRRTRSRRAGTAAGRDSRPRFHASVARRVRDC